MFFEVFKPLSYVLLEEPLYVRDYLTQSIFSIAVNHSEEARELSSKRDEI